MIESALPLPQTDRRVRLAIFVAAGTAAAAVAASLVFGMSSAAFTAETANEDNAWTSGVITLTDDDADVALFSAENIVPGYTETNNITVSYTGPQDADLVFDSSVNGTLAPFLDLTVTRDGAEVYNGDLTNFATDPALTITPDAAEVWDFTVTLPADVGNEAQGLLADATFTWTATVAE